MVNEVNAVPDEQVDERVKGVAQNDLRFALQNFRGVAQLKDPGEQALEYADDHGKDQGDQNEPEDLLVEAALHDLAALDHHPHDVRKEQTDPDEDHQPADHGGGELVEGHSEKDIHRHEHPPASGLEHPVLRYFLQESGHVNV